MSAAGRYQTCYKTTRASWLFFRVMCDSWADDTPMKGEHFPRANTFQGRTLSKGEHFPRANTFQGRTLSKGKMRPNARKDERMLVMGLKGRLPKEERMEHSSRQRSCLWRFILHHSPAARDVCCCFARAGERAATVQSHHHHSVTGSCNIRRG